MQLLLLSLGPLSMFPSCRWVTRPSSTTPPAPPLSPSHEQTATTRTSLIINVEYNQLDPILRATVSPEGDVNDPDTGLSPFPGNTNNLVFMLEPYLKVILFFLSSPGAAAVAPSCTSCFLLLRMLCIRGLMGWGVVGSNGEKLWCKMYNAPSPSWVWLCCVRACDCL